MTDSQSMGSFPRKSSPELDVVEQVNGSFGRWQLRTILLIFLCKIPSAWFTAIIIYTAPYPWKGNSSVTRPIGMLAGRRRSMLIGTIRFGRMHAARIDCLMWTYAMPIPIHWPEDSCVVMVRSGTPRCRRNQVANRRYPVST